MNKNAEEDYLTILKPYGEVTSKMLAHRVREKGKRKLILRTRRSQS